jgi:hypothetical protein
MIGLVKTGSLLGYALLLFGILAGIIALLILSVMRLINALRGDSKTAAKDPVPKTDGVGVVVGWLAWLIFAAISLVASFGEMFTRFSDAGFGFIYITLGMPVFLVAWLGLNIFASVGFLSTRWLFGTLGAAGLIVFGYGNIN